MTREDNPYLNKTYVYTYDNAGNRTSRKTYAYTTGTLGTVISTENYQYDGDRLTRVGSMQYTYDTIGNLTSYNGYSLDWEGRNLVGISMDNGYTFEYNADGIRTQKTHGNAVYLYGLNGSQIVTETKLTRNVDGTETFVYLLVYLYDENGMPIGFQYRDTNSLAYQFDTYYFEKNLQGDIIAVYTEGGTKIGSYTYDAWGVCSYSYASGATSAQKQIVSTLNPFRYRGYYYDTETGFYYLQTRYYNPQWGRFLNADGYVNANGNLIGYNMFTYCSNNPVIYLDTNGQSLSDIWNGICDFVDSFVEWLNSIKNKDGSFSLYDNDRFNDKDIWHEQFFVITPDDMQYSIANGDLSLGLAADFCTGGWEWKHFDLSLFDFGHAEGSISNNGLSGMASIWSPSIAFIFDEVRIEIGFEAGAVGIEDNIAIANNQVNIAFAYGWGISLNVSW